MVLKNSKNNANIIKDRHLRLLILCMRTSNCSNSRLFFTQLFLQNSLKSATLITVDDPFFFTFLYSDLFWLAGCTWSSIVPKTRKCIS